MSTRSPPAAVKDGNVEDTSLPLDFSLARRQRSVVELLLNGGSDSEY